MQAEEVVCGGDGRDWVHQVDAVGAFYGPGGDDDVFRPVPWRRWQRLGIADPQPLLRREGQRHNASVYGLLAVGKGPDEAEIVLAGGRFVGGPGQIPPAA